MDKEKDKRLIDLKVSKGLAKTSEIENLLKSLPDEAANAEWVKIDSDENSENPN